MFFVACHIEYIVDYASLLAKRLLMIDHLCILWFNLGLLRGFRYSGNFLFNYLCTFSCGLDELKINKRRLLFDLVLASIDDFMWFFCLKNGAFEAFEAFPSEANLSPSPPKRAYHETNELAPFLKQLARTTIRKFPNSHDISIKSNSYFSLINIL